MILQFKGERKRIAGKNKEIQEFFDRRAESYQKEINPYLTHIRAEFIRNFAQGEILDVGVGPGLLPKQYASEAKITGVDIALPMLELAKKALPNSHLCQADSENLPFAGASFDTIVCSEVIYYLERPEKFIREAARVLRRPGCLLIILGNSRYNFLYKKLGQLGLRPLDPYGLKTISEKKVRAILENNLSSFEVEIYGLGLPLFKISRLAVFSRLSPVLAFRVKLG